MFVLCLVFPLARCFVHVQTVFLMRRHFFCILEKESDTFDNFLKLLGDRIVLKGWSKFRGGLDAKSAYEIS